MPSQYDYDKLEFRDLFCRVTGISHLKVDAYLRENDVRNIFEHPASLDITPKQLDKVNDLMKVFSLYSNLKGQEQTYKINSSEAARNYFINRVGEQRDREIFYCAFLNYANEIIKTKEAFTGTINESPVFPREIVKYALNYGAASVIIAHNHPGGSLMASSADKEVTRRIGQALKTVQINLLDHIIVGKQGQGISLAETGELDQVLMRVAETPQKDYIMPHEREIDR